MADFCKACAAEVFGPGVEADLGGITLEPDWLQGKAVAVLCEGCGPIQVDPEGNCVSRDCLCAGEPGHGLPWHLEPSKIINETPTGWVQTAEPWPLLPRTKHQLVDPPGMVDFSALELRVGAVGGASEAAMLSIGMAGGDMMFSAGRSERDSTGAGETRTDSQILAAQENPLFPPFQPFQSFEVTGFPLEDLAVEQEYQFEQQEVKTDNGSIFLYTTSAWPGALRLVSVFGGTSKGDQLQMEVSVGREEVPPSVNHIKELLNQAIAKVESSVGLKNWAEFHRFHGNAVVYDPKPKELMVTTECLSIVYSFVRQYHPGFEVTGLVQGYNFDGPLVRLFGKLKEEADPNARADLKDA